ncbi:hypothetical protein, partial [Metabacillus niabensis]|uniref:hypothetical protein n=1 Tax=Metabacillus niabensis TaxID=324854 RepID=UPI0039A3DB6D
MRRNNYQIDEEYITNLFRHSTDVSIEKQHLYGNNKEEQILIIYCNGLIEHKLLINSILPDI